MVVALAFEDEAVVLCLLLSLYRSQRGLRAYDEIFLIVDLPRLLPASIIIECSSHLMTFSNAFVIGSLHCTFALLKSRSGGVRSSR